MTVDVKIRVARLEEEAVLPTLKHDGDAGVDFYCLYDTIIAPNKFKIVRTGVTVEFPENYHGLLKPKGSSNHLVGAGVIESSYQGEILFKLFNPTDEQRVFRSGDAIGQMILIPSISPIPIETSLKEIHENKTKRSDTGGIVEQIEEYECSKAR